MTKVPRSLLEALERVADHRRVNRSHPLPAVLAMSVCAMLCGARSLYAIAQWGRDHGKEIAKALGFRRERTPAVATFHYVFKGLDVEAFERELTVWALEIDADVVRRAMAIDGKTLRGTTGRELPAVHLLAAFSQHLGIVVAQQNVGEKGSELAGARELLAKMDLHGVVVTGDALFAQRDLSRLIKKKAATTSSRSRTTSRRSERNSRRSLPHLPLPS